VQVRGRAGNGAFGRVQTASPPGEDGLAPRLAVNPDGQAAVAWTRWNGGVARVAARTRAETGRLFAMRTLSGEGGTGDEPDVAVDDSGAAVVVWRRDRGSGGYIQLRPLTAPRGLPGRVQTLSSVEAGDPRVALSADGAGSVVWLRRDGGVGTAEARDRSADGHLRPVRVLAGGDAGAPVIADKGGARFVAWTIGEHVAAADWSTFITPHVYDVSDIRRDAIEPTLDTDASGDALLVWTRFDGVERRVEARFRSAAGDLGPIETISPPGNASSPRVAVDPAGDAVIVWIAASEVHARLRAADGSLGPVLDVSGALTPAREPAVDVDDDGNALIVWGFGTFDKLRARSLSATGRLGAVQSVTDASILLAGAHDVAVDADGDAVIAYGAETRDFRDVAVAVRRSRTGTLGGLFTLAEGGSSCCTLAGMDVEIAAGGDAVIAWALNGVQAAAWPADPGAAPLPTRNLGGGQGPDLALDPAGDAFVAWGLGGRPVGLPDASVVYGRSLPTTGPVGPKQTIMSSSLDPMFSEPKVTMDRTGTAVVAAVRPASGGLEELQVRSCAPDASCGDLTTLAGPSSRFSFRELDLAGGAVGDAVAVWSRELDGTFRVEAAAGR
jgi:hypothetical protein